MLVSKEYRLVRKLKVFDPGYYLSRRTTEEELLDPLAHYLRWKGDDPVLRTGWYQNPEPHPLFDSCFYIQRYFPEGLEENPFVHYLFKGWLEGFWPGPYLDPQSYGARTGWKKEMGNPLVHYTHVGAAQVVSPSPYFDVEYYLDRNPILASVRNEIIKHYKLHGARTGQSPIPVFDPEYYLDQVGEEAKDDPLAHFVTTGCADPAPCFDRSHVRRVYGSRPGMELEDYLTEGVFKRHASVPDVGTGESGKVPLISILVPVYNPDPGVLNSCIRSVLYQPYPNWQLCLADDCSTDPRVRSQLERWQALDPRIKVTFLQKNSGISTATNRAAELADGEYFGFLDNDDELSPDCLLQVVKTIRTSGAELIYSDEDLIGDDGTRFSTFFKPAYNPELLLSHNYITHFVVVRRDLFERVGGCDPRRDGAQDFDLLLKLSEQTENIVHIDQVLYHWRASESSTSVNHEQKGYAHEAGRQALSETLARRGIAGEVRDTELNYFYRVRHSHSTEMDVTIFCTEKAVDGGQQKSRIEKSMVDHQISSCQILSGFSPEASEGIAQKVEKTESEWIVLLGQPVDSMDPGWLDEMVGWASQPGVGLVCGRIFYQGGDGPSYSLPDPEDPSFAAWKNFLVYGARHQHGMHCSQRIWCADHRFCLFKRETVQKLGGLDVNLSSPDLVMLDFSFRLRAAGYHLIYTPWARMRLAEEMIELNTTNETIGEEWFRFCQKYQGELLVGDPWYNASQLKEAGIDKELYKVWCTKPRRAFS